MYIVLLFLARDGDILRRVYQKLYPDDRTVYVYWSRKAATKLMADEDKHDFFRRFIYHKVNQKVSIGDALRSMELEKLIPELSAWPEIWTAWEKKNGGAKADRSGQSGQSGHLKGQGVDRGVDSRKTFPVYKDSCLHLKTDRAII